MGKTKRHDNHRCWYGVLLLRSPLEPGGEVEVCIVFDSRRDAWELPKGGAEWKTKRASTGKTDADCFEAARAELWEEAGVKLALRTGSDLLWLDPQGNKLDEQYPKKSAWLITQLWPADEVRDPLEEQYHGRVAWLPIDQALAQLRPDHAAMLLQALGIQYSQMSAPTCDINKLEQWLDWLRLGDKENEEAKLEHRNDKKVVSLSTACLLCRGSGLLWPSRLSETCPLCDGDSKWLQDESIAPSAHAACEATIGPELTPDQVTLHEVRRLCSVGTAGETAQRQEKALAGGGPKRTRAKHARETIDILIAGYYSNESASQVDLSTCICDAVAASTHLPHASWKPPLPAHICHTLALEVRCCTVLAAAQDLASLTVAAPGVLNFASARNPGGGFLTGAEAQEESLARSSGIYPCLSKHFDAFFAPSRKAASGLYTHDLIYSPSVPVIRDQHGALLDKPYLVDFVTGAAPNCGVLKSRLREENAAAQCRDALHERIRCVLHVFASNSCADIVLGAWGCGVFGNDPATVAQLFGSALAEFQCFRRVIFAVLDPKMAQTFGEELEVLVEGLEGADLKDSRLQNNASKKGRESAKPVSRKDARRQKEEHLDDE